MFQSEMRAPGPHPHDLKRGGVDHLGARFVFSYNPPLSTQTPPLLGFSLLLKFSSRSPLAFFLAPPWSRLGAGTSNRRLGAQIDVWELKLTSGTSNRRLGAQIDVWELKLTFGSSNERLGAQIDAWELKLTFGSSN